jgi:uncharacterized membrane protein
MKTKEFLKREWFLWILILAPTAFAIYHWPDFSDKVPIHWNFKGDIDNYAGKWAVFLAPMISLGVYMLMLVLPKIDPRKKNYDKFTGAYFMIRVVLIVLMCIVGFISCISAMGVKLNTGMIVMLAVSGMTIIMGNQFGRIRTNYFVGFRTPWTLNNEEVWTKTHRFAAKIWVISGLVLLPSVIFLPATILGYVFIPFILAIAIVPFVYSWKIHKQIVKENISNN